MAITISEKRDISKLAVIELYNANEWSSAKKPEKLYKGLINSHTLITAWSDDQLIGLGNAISDGYLVVYYPHLLVHPNHQRKGIGQMIMARMKKKYQGMHMQILTADMATIGFYEKIGFVRAGKTAPMWIYDGNEH